MKSLKLALVVWVSSVIVICRHGSAATPSDEEQARTRVQNVVVNRGITEIDHILSTRQGDSRVEIAKILLREMKWKIELLLLASNAGSGEGQADIQAVFSADRDKIRSVLGVSAK